MTHNRIAFFGGSFDPIHLGHLEIARIAKDQFALAKVVFIPTSQNPLKANSPIASNQHRLRMLELALKDYNWSEVSTEELKNETKNSYTIDTLRKLIPEYCSDGAKPYLIMGTDQLSKFHLWKDYQRLGELVDFILFTRQDAELCNENLSNELLAKLKTNLVKVDFPISASEIREKIGSGNFAGIQKFLPERVGNYLVEHSLYT